MADVMFFLAAPLVMAFILAGIHCYFGLHVLQRGVIFIDLSLAQVAALGTVVAFLSGSEHDSISSYLMSLAFTLAAALFLSWVNHHNKKVSQEAVIGILYALASALVIVLIDLLSHGSEHLKSALVGQLLWVTWPTVAKTAAIYLAVGGVLWTFRKALFQASFEGARHWGWDFLFYALFAIVITSSVHVAGVLLVFSLLIVPALVSTLFEDTFRRRLLFAWAFAVVFCCLGILSSYLLDWPAGASLVIVFSATGLLSVALKKP